MEVKLSLLTPFLNGLLHPLHGMDHLMMAIGVGLWSVEGSKKPDLKLPLLFLATLMLGFGFGTLRAPSLASFQGQIPASLILLGLVFLSGIRFSSVLKWTTVSVFGALHGHTHGVEMSTGQTFILTLPFQLLGLVLSTGILHLSGISLWVAIQRFLREPQAEWALRVAGFAVFSSAFFTE